MFPFWEIGDSRGNGSVTSMLIEEWGCDVWENGRCWRTVVTIGGWWVTTAVTLFNLTWSKHAVLPGTSEVRKATSGCSYGGNYHMHFPSCRVWDVNDGSLVNRLDHHSGWVLCLRFNSDTMVTGSSVMCIVYLCTCTAQIEDRIWMDWCHLFQAWGACDPQ